MSQNKALEKLQAKRVELEASSRLLIEEQEKLEKSVQDLEERIIIEEMKKEKTIIEDLRKRNNAVKEFIASLEAKKKELESKLNQTLQLPVSSSPEGEEEDLAEEGLEPVEVVPEEFEESFSVTAVVDEALIKDQKVVRKSSSRQEKKKRRFF